MEGGSAEAQRDMGGVYVLKVLLNWKAYRNDQKKIKKMRN